jgi:hypothetical protein
VEEQNASLEVQPLPVGQLKWVRTEIIIAGPDRVEDFKYGPVLRIGNAAWAIEIVKGNVVNAP